MSQSGGNFLFEVRNLAVPFTLLLAQLGAKQFKSKQGTKRKESSSKKVSKTKNTAKKTTK